MPRLFPPSCLELRSCYFAILPAQLLRLGNWNLSASAPDWWRPPQTSAEEAAAGPGLGLQRGGAWTRLSARPAQTGVAQAAVPEGPLAGLPRARFLLRE